MPYIIAIIILISIFYLIKKRKNIEIFTKMKPYYYIISIILFIVSFLIIYKYSFQLESFLLIALISIIFFLNLKLQGLSKNGVFLIKGPGLFGFISYKGMKNMALKNHKDFIRFSFNAHGSFHKMEFDKELETEIKNLLNLN